MELYGFMEREKKIPSYFFIITKSKSMAAVIQPVLRLPYNAYGGRHTRVLQPSHVRRSSSFSSSIEKKSVG